MHVVGVQEHLILLMSRGVTPAHDGRRSVNVATGFCLAGPLR
jgi:hypothetical protein